MARKKNAGAKRRKNRNKKRPLHKKPQEVLIPLSAFRMRYPELSEEWSPIVVSSLRRKRVKVGEGYRWVVLSSTEETRHLSKITRGEFEAWQHRLKNPSSINP